MAKRDGPYQLYVRKRGKRGRPRWYVEFSKDFNETLREMAKAAGDLERASRKNLCRMPLCKPGSKRATDDEELAKKLAADKLAEIRAFERRGVDRGTVVPISLRKLVGKYIEYKEEQANEGRDGAISERWFTQTRKHLALAADFFGPETDPAKIDVDDVRRYLRVLQRKPNGRGGIISEGTQLHYLNSLSRLYGFAASRKHVKSRYNPVGDLDRDEKPKVSEGSRDWLEYREAALLLEAARLWKPDPDAGAIPFAYPLIATLLYTGARKSEAFGLGVEDVSFDDKSVHIRPNPWGRERSKTRKSARRSQREGPLWPQLEVILREYLFGSAGPKGDGLLFPSHRTGRQLHNIDRTLQSIVELAGVESKVTVHVFRHTYPSIRVQTLHLGKPVTLWRVAQEIGHTTTAQIEERYGHLARHPIRMEGVDLRMPRWIEALRKAAEAEHKLSTEDDDTHALIARSLNERADRDARWWREKTSTLRAKAGIADGDEILDSRDAPAVSTG